ncbi:MAG: glycerate kinase type-2 family protein [Acidobacteriaceae bacterium]
MTHTTHAEDLRQTAREIFLHALADCSIPAALDRYVRITTGPKGTLLHSAPECHPDWSISLSNTRCIYLFAMGKAALPMLDALLAKLPHSLKVRGICTAPTLPAKPDKRIRYFAGGHPEPNKASFAAAKAMLRQASRLDPRDFVFFLISGGASAMLELPYDQRISLKDTIAFHRVLIHSGASIAEINCVRKHFSAVKGGRLGAAVRSTPNYSLLVSDVPGKHLDALGSSPTLPDRSTVAECRAILARYHLLEQFPASVRSYFEQQDLPETPANKDEVQMPTHGSVTRIHVEPACTPHGMHALLLSNEHLVGAAKKHAESLGFHVEVDNTCDDWGYAQASEYLLYKLRSLRQQYRRVCLLSGGEVTVHVTGEPGIGGRNQQFALACASLLRERDHEVAILSAGSDGIDGNSAAAGAVVDSTTLARAKNLQWDTEEALRQFNASPIFAALHDAIVTGPTGNNLRDLRVLLSVSDDCPPAAGHPASPQIPA